MIQIKNSKDLWSSVNDKENVYDMQYMEINNPEDIVSSYASELDKTEVEEFYNELNVDLSNEKVDDLEKKLKENYDKELTLKDLQELLPPQIQI